MAVETLFDRLGQSVSGSAAAAQDFMMRTRGSAAHGTYARLSGLVIWRQWSIPNYAALLTSPA
jgi:hypothetical protein